MRPNKKVPIERINKFFSQDDFDLEIGFGREWLEGDINIKVILYQVDRGETTIDDIYGEAAKEDIMFKPPVEIPVSFNMAAPSNKVITLMFISPSNHSLPKPISKSKSS